jgi:CelD/BcsL family acetyltransferase involved in cellulose biosynthesis
MAAALPRAAFERAAPDQFETMPMTGRVGGSCDIAVIRDRAGFESLATEWTELFERAGRPEQLFQTFEWLDCWADHFLDDPGRLRLVIGRRDGRLAMVWPLIITTNCFGLAQLGWMGEPVSQYGDALLEPGPLAHETLVAGWSAVRALGADVALFRKTRGDSNVGALLAVQAIACEHAEAPFAQFRGKTDFAMVLSRRSPKAQSSRRRLLRRLQETGDISFETGADPQSAQSLLRAAFRMKRDWLLRRGLYSAPIESDAMLTFFLDFAARAPDQVTTLVDAILRDGQPVSVGVTLACKGSGFGHLLAHDPDCDKQGAGVLLAEHVMKSCFARRLERYDMLAPYDAYKAEWADDAVPAADFIAGFTPPGKLFAYAWSSGARQRIKTAVKKMPARAGRMFWPVARIAMRKVRI